MSKTVREASQEVSELVDRLGEHLIAEDWIAFLEEVECDCDAKRQAAEDELEDLD